MGNEAYCAGMLELLSSCLHGFRCYGLQATNLRHDGQQSDGPDIRALS